MPTTCMLLTTNAGVPLGSGPPVLVESPTIALRFAVVRLKLGAPTPPLLQ